MFKSERGATMTVVAIAFAVLLMFIFPLMNMADRKDDVATLEIQTETDRYVKEIATKGKTTQDAYDNFVQTLISTGNAYDVDIVVQILDENPSKKEASSSYAKIGENVYLTLHTTQVLNKLKEGSLILKEGDIVTVTVKNINQTIGMQLRNFVFKVTGNNNSSILATSTMMVTANGQ